jgi:TonB-linked SusC/RagA family outer membrane protein
MLIEAFCHSLRHARQAVREGTTRTIRSTNKTIVNAMKLTAILVLAAALQVSARGSAQTVTWTGKSVELQQVFSMIKAQTGYLFFYRKEDLQGAKAVSAQFTNASLQEVLTTVLAGQSLRFSIKGNTVFILKKEESRTPLLESSLLNMPPPGDIRGRVVNEKGEALAGAFVKLKGTANGAVTNEKGEFVLSNIDAAEAELEISFVGYESQHIKLKGKSVLNITLATEVNNLDAANISVVSTGYQTLPKERSAGSFAKPDMTILNNRTGTMNVLQRLDGLIPGLTINNANSDNLQIRGLTSIGVLNTLTISYAGTSRAPLVIVDGIPVSDIATVNPNDVGDITVLKDATAASIWGSRAANGVIVITTKQGNRSGRLKVEYDGFVNFLGKPDLANMPVLNSRQFIQAAKDIFDPVNTTWASVSIPPYSVSQGVAPHEKILYDWSRGIISATQKDASLDSLASISNQAQIKDIFYRNALLTNHTVSIRGGGEKYSFYGSFAYTGSQSSTPGNNTNTFKINARQDYRPNPFINIYLVSDLTNTRGSASPLPSANNSFLPYQLFRDANGNNISMPWLYRPDSLRNAYEAKSGISLNYNPIAEGEYGYTKGDALLARLTGGIAVKIWDGLRFEGTYGIVKGSNNSRQYESQDAYAVRSEVVSFATGSVAANNVRYFMPQTGGRYTTGNTGQENWTLRNQFAYNKSWKGLDHQLSAIAGAEVQDALSRGTTTLVRGFNPQLGASQALNYDTLSKGVVNTIMLYNSSLSAYYNPDYSFSEVESRFRSYYTNIAYTYLQKYTVNGSWRQDKSSLFGIDKAAQNKPVWSAGASWLISRENFMNELTWLNKLNIRATYGITGNAPSPGTAASNDIISAGTISSNFPGGRAYSIASFANRSLTWESTRVINLGIDFSVLNNRISGSLDLYSKKTDNLLGNMPANGFTGVTTIVGNLGDLTNKGIELGLNTVNIQSRNFSWNTLWNIAYNQNKVVRLATALTATTGNAVITNNSYGGFYEGYAAYAIFAYDYAGLDNMGDPQIRLADKTVSKALNVAKPGDMVFMGTYQPKWSGGLSNTFRYKAFSLSVNAIYNLGHVMRRDVNTFYTTNRLTPGAGSLTSGNKHADFANRWQKAGDETITDIPAWVGNSSTSTSRRYVNYYIYGNNNVVSASYIKLRDITLSYSLPQHLLRKIRTEGITLKLQMGNIMLWKANKFNIDPEFQNAIQGTRGQLANQHTVSIGAHVTF